MDNFILYIYPLLYVSPCYAANAAPLFLDSLFDEKRPLDMGKKLSDGRRIFGDGKTLEGTLFGLLIGFVYFMVLYNLSNFLRIELYLNWIEGILLVTGTMFGDLLGSFIKRRIGIERGEMLPIFDQTGFLIFAIFFRSLVLGPLPYDFVIYVFMITFIVHIFTNVSAFKMGLKKKPY
ncbi:MAG: CDP-2,3-bis-(O-geranylgeranyl)-sn-glycerol synthase [Thermoproteota archaeon]|jgi:CDP-2,3-bis-(O-geranylgeranyl)-sn-glycerol synthase|nr:CDP-2,3-bis-(O-geranylgeranyl)-sn-glycerol synthase [Thermoproteota archaeon]